MQRFYLNQIILVNAAILSISSSISKVRILQSISLEPKIIAIIIATLLEIRKVALSKYRVKEFSDLIKDVVGYRPDTEFWEWFDKASEEERQAKWDRLVESYERDNGVD